MTEEIVKQRALSANRDKVNQLVRELKIVYTDVDGTLLGPGGCLFLTSKQHYSLVPAEAIIAAHRHNIDIVMVSGRNGRQLHGDARILGLKNYIAELGCQIIYNLGEEIILNVGDLPLTKKTVHESINATGAPQLLFSLFEKKLEYHTPWSENRECTHVMRGYINVEKANRLLAENNLNFLKVIDNGVIHPRSDELAPDLPEIHAYHLLPAGSGKPEGVKKDREIRRIDKASCIAIGDAYSDVQLAPEVGALFLVRNALSEGSHLLEEIARHGNVFITEEEMGLGWAEIIRFFPETK